MNAYEIQRPFDIFIYDLKANNYDLIQTTMFLNGDKTGGFFQLRSGNKKICDGKLGLKNDTYVIRDLKCDFIDSIINELQLTENNKPSLHGISKFRTLEGNIIGFVFYINETRSMLNNVKISVNKIFELYGKFPNWTIDEQKHEQLVSLKKNFGNSSEIHKNSADEKRNKSTIANESNTFLEDRRRLEEENRQREFAKSTQRINLQITSTQPNAEGDLTISIQTNADTASLKINGEELGGRPDGKYVVSRVARAGQETRFEIVAKDVYGNADTKTITVSRAVIESKVTYPNLSPGKIKRQPERDAVAVIIGISNYKSLPKADFAKDDAQVFFDYAIRALGVKPGNIKLLMDEQADAEEIYTAFKTWLPARVKSTTDVYVFYSGHGLPTQDGTGLYWLPQRANRDVISKTAILMQDINSDIQASKPKSVTIFMDACYSGQARGGETLVASARPIALKSQPTTFPSNFTVITASQADQISSSSPDLQHGIFSYYLMRGMEGDADLNKDGKITLDEIQAYLSENVGRHARTMNRQQEPQVIGDGSRVLVGR